MYVSDEGKEVIFPVYLMTIPFSYVRKMLGRKIVSDALVR